MNSLNTNLLNTQNLLSCKALALKALTYLQEFLAQTLQELLFENCCAGCAQVASALCDQCQSQLLNLQPRYKLLYLKDKSYCLCAMSKYEAMPRRIILAVKHGVDINNQLIIQLLAIRLAKNIYQLVSSVACEPSKLVITYVPASWKRRLRGKNYNKVIAKTACEYLKHTIARQTEHEIDLSFEKLVEFKLDARSQKNKSADQRFENRYSNVVLWDSKLQKDNSKPVIYAIFDDVVTTGATLLAVAYQFEKYIADKDKICFFTLASALKS